MTFKKGDMIYLNRIPGNIKPLGMITNFSSSSEVGDYYCVQYIAHSIIRTSRKLHVYLELIPKEQQDSARLIFELQLENLRNA